MGSDTLLGIGLYTPHEAARYVRADVRRFRRWLYGHGASQPVFEPQLGRELANELVTFLDFAQALSVQDVRLNVGIPLQKIREAYRRAQEEYQIPYPFAFEHGIFIFGNLKDPKACQLGIYLPEQSEIPEEEFLKRKQVQLTGRHKGNLLISRVVQEFSRKLRFAASGIADRYSAYSGRGHEIIMDCNYRFGKPCVIDVGYEAQTLADAARIEGGPERAAGLYKVPESAVKAAIDYMRELDAPLPRLTPTTITAA